MNPINLSCQEEAESDSRRASTTSLAGGQDAPEPSVEICHVMLQAFDISGAFWLTHLFHVAHKGLSQNLKLGYEKKDTSKTKS